MPEKRLEGDSIPLSEEEVNQVNQADGFAEEEAEAEELELEASDDANDDTDTEEVSVDDELPITDCAIEVAPAEIKPGEIVQSEVADESKGHLTELTCDPCLEMNLVSKSCIKCARCEKAFCLHFASTVDAQYCVNCLSDVSVTKQVVTKIYEHQNPETGEKTFYRRKAREIKIEGLDWLFSQRKIAELSDVELDLTVEYHRNILNLMIAEQERRRNEKMHRYANIQFKVPKTPATTKSSDLTVTTVKKTRTISKDKQSEQLAAILKSMLSKGLTPEQIQAMLKK